MRKILSVALVACVALLVVAASAFASPGPKATGGVEWLSGNLDIHSEFTAQGTPDNAKGHVNVRAENVLTNDLFLDYKGTVDCLRVVGNVAYISGSIDKISGSGASGPNGPSQYFLWAVEDNGEGAKATAPDAIFTIRSTSPLTCRANLTDRRDQVNGNIQVSS